MELLNQLPSPAAQEDARNLMTQILNGEPEPSRYKRYEDPKDKE